MAEGDQQKLSISALKSHNEILKREDASKKDQSKKIFLSDWIASQKSNEEDEGDNHKDHLTQSDARHDSSDSIKRHSSPNPILPRLPLPDDTNKRAMSLPAGGQTIQLPSKQPGAVTSNRFQQTLSKLEEEEEEEEEGGKGERKITKEKKMPKIFHIATMAKQWKSKVAEETSQQQKQSAAVAAATKIHAQRESLPEEEIQEKLNEAISKDLVGDALQEALMLVTKTENLYRSYLGGHHVLTQKVNSHAKYLHEVISEYNPKLSE